MLSRITLIEILIVVAVLGLLGVTAYKFVEGSNRREAFLAECEEAAPRKPYECKALWRRAQP